MGRLFWKIFLGLWLTLLITGAIVGGVIWQHNKKRIEQLEILIDSPRADFNVNSLARVLRNNGLRALDRLIERRNRHEHRPLPVFIVNSTGEELLGRPISELILNKARKALSDPQQSAVQQVITPEGEKLLLFMPRHNHPAMKKNNHSPKRLPLIPLVIVLLGSLLFSAALAWYITRPIRYLREATNQFAEGRLDTRVMHKFGQRKDEITDLAQDFDYMAEQVQQLVAAQKRLLDDVSHELRSPLARLQIAVEMIRQQPDKTEQLMQRIEKESTRLDELVGELLTLSRLESDVYKDENDYFDISGLLESISEDAFFEAKNQNKQVIFNNLPIHDNELLIKGNIELLRRAIENVIRNAIYYTPEHTQVIISLNYRHRELVITVCDSGKGISEEKLKDLFQPFVRLNNTQQNIKIPGYGLGLAIAYRAIEIHKGKIRAYNHTKQGLCIEISLPV